MQGNWLETRLSMFHLSSTSIEIPTYMLSFSLVFLIAVIATVLIRRTLLKYVTN